MGDTELTLIAGVAVALIAWLRPDTSGGQAGVLVGCLLAAGIGGLTFVRVAGLVGPYSDISRADVGSGLYVLMLGVALAAAGTIAHRLAQK